MPGSPPPEAAQAPTPTAPPANQIAARSLWTLAETLVSAAIAWVAGLNPEDQPGWFATVTIVGSAVLSAVKSFIATKVGDPATVTFKN